MPQPSRPAKIEALAEKRGIGQLDEATQILGVVLGRANSGKDGGNALTYSLPG